MAKRHRPRTAAQILAELEAHRLKSAHTRAAARIDARNPENWSIDVDKALPSHSDVSLVTGKGGVRSGRRSNAFRLLLSARR